MGHRLPCGEKNSEEEACKQKKSHYSHCQLPDVGHHHVEPGKVADQEEVHRETCGGDERKCDGPEMNQYPSEMSKR